MWVVHERSPISVIQILLNKGVNPHTKSKINSNLLLSASTPNERSRNSFIDPLVVHLLGSGGVGHREK